MYMIGAGGDRTVGDISTGLTWFALIPWVGGWLWLLVEWIGALVPFVADADSDEGSGSFAGAQSRRDQQEAMVMTGARFLPVNAAPLPLPVVLHDGKRVAIREQIYDILCICHGRVGHGGPSPRME